MGIKVTCNNVPRHLSALNELPEAVADAAR